MSTRMGHCRTKPSYRGLAGPAVAALSLAVVLAWAAAWPAVAIAQSRVDTQSTCVKCHSDSRFLVQNKKLYDYYQDWTVSIHREEGVTCADCHGGDPAAKDKTAAHGGGSMGSADAASPINYRNIPATCAKCHETVYDQYRHSKHFEHLKVAEQDEQGPSCVTCHGSLNTTVLTVSTVRKTCQQCHNDDTGNFPEIPAQAEDVLNNFLSIHRYYRFIALRSPPSEARAFFQLVDPAIAQLNAEWHKFDIEAIGEKTEDLVQFLKVRRNELLRDAKARRR